MEKSMKQWKTFSRAASFLITVCMMIALFPSLPGAPAAESAYDGLWDSTLRFIDDTRDMLDGSIQTARIIKAKSPTEGVDWGAEPMVLMFYLSDYSADLTVDIEDDTIVEVNRSSYREAPGSEDFYGANGNILTLNPLKVGNTRVTVTATKGTETATCTFIVVVNLYEDTGEYKWGSMWLPGGGAVCGYIFHPTAKDPNGNPILYGQTDVGGAWRYNFETKAWEDMTKWVSAGNSASWGQSRGVGVDPTPGRESWVYIAQGGSLIRSTDYGKSFTSVNTSTGMSMGGNSGNLRGLGGDNIVIVPNLLAGRPQGSTNPDDYGEPTMYMVSPSGIRTSTNNGTTLGTTGLTGLTTSSSTTGVFYAQDNYNLRAVTTATRNGAYFTGDGGASWAQLPGQPAHRAASGNAMYFGCKAAFTAPFNEAGDRYLFVSYNDGNAVGVTDGNGHDGCVFRWTIGADGAVKENGKDGTTNGVNVTPIMVDDTPVKNGGATAATQNRMAGVGMSALSVDLNNPGALIVGTHNTDPYSNDTRYTHRGMETIFRSLDYGEHWFPVLCGYDLYGDLRWGDLAPYSSPATNGEYATNAWELGGNNRLTQTGTEYWWEPWTFLHWNFGPKINPFDSDNMFINSGLGTYVTWNLTALDDVARANGLGEPNYMNKAGLTVAQAQTGLFTTTGTGSTMSVSASRLTSAYTPYKILSKNHLDGSVLASDSVKWECAPDLNMTVQKSSSLYSPPAGRNIVTVNTWDYPGWAWTSLDDRPWNGWSYAQWIPEKWEYLYEGWRQHTLDTDPAYLPAKPTANNHPTSNAHNGPIGDIYAPTNRGISGDNHDVADLNPEIMVSTSRTDWHWNAKGGAIITFDGGRIWHNLPNGWTTQTANQVWASVHPSYALLGAETTGGASWSGYITSSDSACGWVVVSADGKAVFWTTTSMTIANTRRTYADDPLNLGKAWITPTVYSAATGTATLATSTAFKVIADCVLPNVFYGVTNSATGLYMSTDYGATFRPVTVSGLQTGTTTATNSGRATRGVPGVPYHFYISGSGLQEVTVNPDAMTATVSTRTSGGSGGTAAPTGVGYGGYGLGKAATPGGAGVLSGAIYAHGNRSGVSGSQGGYGVYRSLDNGATWTKISPTGSNNTAYDNDNWCFADVRGVMGDTRVFGRVYISTGNASGGTSYGDMVVNVIESGESDKDALGRAIEIFEGLTESHWNASLWANASAAYEEALAVYDDSFVTQLEVDAAEAALRLALDALLPPWIAPAPGQAPSFVLRKNMITQIKISTNLNTANLTFTSSNTNIATVTQTGVVTGKSIGVAVIQVKDTATGAIFNFVVNCTN